MAITAEELLFKISTQVGGTVAVGELARSFLDLNIKVENLTRGLTAITGSTEKAEETFRYLQDTAQKYGVNLLDLSSGYLKLAAASKETNLEGEATTKIFESLTAAMSVLGADTVSTNRAFVALAQMMSKGQIYAEELRGQLAEALPDAIQVMAKALGVGTDQLYELMQAGALSADVLLPFAYELDKRYGNLATSTNTFTQELNRLKETTAEVALDIEDTVGAFSGLTKVMGWLGERGEIVAGVIGGGLAVALGKVAIAGASASKALAEKAVVTWNEGNATIRAAKASVEKAEIDAAAATAAVRSSVIAQQQAVLTEERTNQAILSKQREVAAINSKLAVVSEESLANQRLLATQAASVAAGEKQIAILAAERAARDALLVAKAEGIAAANAEITAALKASQTSGAAVINKQLQVKETTKLVAAIEAEIVAISNGTTTTELITAATARLSAQKAILAEKTLLADAATTKAVLSHAKLNEVLKSRNFAGLIAAEQEMLKASLANTASLEARKLKAESLLITEKAAYAAKLQELNLTQFEVGLRIRQIEVQQLTLSSKIALGTATEAEIALEKTLIAEKNQLILTQNSLAVAEKNNEATKARYSAQIRSHIALEQKLGVQIYSTIDAETKLAIAEWKRADALVRRAARQQAATAQAVQAAQSELAGLLQTSAASDLKAAAEERLYVLQQKLIAQEEQLSAARIGQAQTTDRVTAANERLALSGAQEVAAANVKIAQLEQQAILAADAVRRTELQILQAERRVAALVAEGGSASLLAAAEADLLIAREAGNIAAQRSVVAGEALTAEKLKQTAANEVLDASNKKLAVSQGILSKLWVGLTGPTGMIALMVAGFAYMYYAFRDQDDATKNLSLSTEEYTKKLELMTAAQIANSNIKAAEQIAEKKELIKTLDDEIRRLDGENIRLLSGIKSWTGLANALAFWTTKEDDRRQAMEESAKTEAELEILEGKRALGLEAIIGKSAELNTQNQESTKRNAELTQKLKDQQKVVNDLRGIFFKSADEVIRLGAATEKLNALQKQKVKSDTDLKTSQLLLNDAVEYYVEQSGLSRKQVEDLIAGRKLDVNSLTAQERATVANVQQQIKLNAESKSLAAQIRVSQAENIRLEKTIRANAEATLKEATALGDLTAKRQADIERAEVAQQLAEQGLVTENLQLRQLQNLLAVEQSRLTLNAKNKNEIQEKINKLLVQIETQKGVVAQTEANIRVTAAEAEAVRNANRIISESFEGNRQRIVDIAGEIAGLREEYRNLSGMSETVFNQRQADILTEIAKKEQEAAQAAKNMGAELVAMYAAVGVSSEEALLGMDFVAKQGIASLKKLASEGQLSAAQLAAAFENVLGKTDNEAEILTLQDALIAMGEQGEISADLLALSLAKVQVKLTEVNAAADPIQQALEQLGTGVPQKLDALANSAAAAFGVIANAKAPIDEVQQAFLKYAEAALLAAENGGKSVDPMLAQQATAIGLSAAYDELQNKLREVNPEIEAINAQFDRLAERQDLQQELTLATTEAEKAWLETQADKAEALGSESERREQLIAIAQKQAELTLEGVANDQQDLALNLERIRVIEEELATTGGLSAAQEEELAIRKASIPVIEQQISASKAKAEQAELEAEKTRLANTLISEELSRQREISAGLQTEIASLQGEYDKLVEAGVPLELLSDLLEQIRLKQEELKNSATGIDKALNDAYTSIGLNAEEVMTGMDFDTRRQIDAFDELASSGKLSADNIQRAFTNVLSKANTVDEVEAIKQKLVDLAIQGKVTGDELAQGITEVNTKLVKLRGETDATTKAMEKLGTGVPEQLNAVADEMEAAYNVLKRTQAPLDEVQQGFLKYAEAALTAAENGAKIDVAQLKTEASALGLSNAFEELQRKTKEANSELDASIAKNEREQTVLERSIALKEQQRDVEEQSIKTKKGVAEIAGNLSKISQAQAELDAKAIEDAQAKIKEMESEIAKTKELIVELEKLQKAKTITPEEAERLKLYQDEVKAKQLIIDKTKEEIPLMVKKAEASAIEAGPLGEAVRLYQAKADAMERNIVAMNEEIKQSQALQQQQVTEEQQALQLLELDKQALVVGAQTLQSEIAAAEAAGDTAKANELKLKLADNLIEQAEQEIKIAEQKVRVAKELVDMAKAEEAAAKKKAAAYQEAAEAMAKLAAATKAKAQADGDYSEEEKKAVATLEAKTAILKGEVIAQNAAADAAKAAVEAGEKQVKIANEGVKAAKAAKEAAEANKEALKDQIANQDKDTDSKKNNTKATKDNTQAAKDRAAALEAARKAAEEAAKAEKERLEAMKKATEDAKKELQDLQIELLDTKGFDKQAAMLQEAASYSKELADLEAQRLAATEEGNLDLAKVLKDQIDVLGDIYAQKKKTYQLDLENKEGLRDARLELMGLNAEVLDEQGFAFAAEQLQQQIDYEGQLSDLRQQRLEAEKSGNIELINVLDEQKIVLGQINDLKLASIEQGYLDDIKAIQQEITDVTKEAATERLEIERDYQDELQKITDESKDAKVEAQKDVNEAYDDLIKDSLEASKEYSKSVEEELAAVAESLTEVDKDYAESVADLLEKSAETFADINEAADESLAELVTSIEERTKEAQSTLADSAESLRRELLSAQGKDGEVIAAEFGDQLQELVEQAALAGEAGKEVLNQAIADALELQNLQLDADKKSGELTDSEYSKAKEAIQERVDGLNEILATEQAIIAAKDEADKLKIEDERQAALDLAEQEKTKAQADLEDELIAKKAAIADELVDKLAALDIAHAEELANIQETYTENKASIDQALQDELASIKQARDEKLKDIAADKKEQLNTINEELKLSKEQLTVELDKAKSVMEQTTAQKALNTEMTTTLSISKEIAASFTQISAAQSSITSFLNELETAKKRSF